MPRKPRWEEKPLRDGVMTINLSSWRYFADYINQEMLDFRTYVYRGQSNAQWKLESTLDRILRSTKRLASDATRRNHLSAFKHATRGRRGVNPPALATENDWWALGQHNGLATPLLDFTESPFVALYFAFEEAYNHGSDARAVFALSQRAVEAGSIKARRQSSEANRHQRREIVEIVRPLSDENIRLVNQRGLFARGPDGLPIDDWIRKYFQGDTSEEMHLIRLEIPDDDRETCLRSLNRMNINHLSLFPDLHGASQFCNYDLTIPKY